MINLPEIMALVSFEFFLILYGIIQVMKRQQKDSRNMESLNMRSFFIMLLVFDALYNFTHETVNDIVDDLINITLALCIVLAIWNFYIYSRQVKIFTTKETESLENKGPM